MKMQSKRGVTVVALSIAVAIVAILTAAVLVNIDNIKELSDAMDYIRKNNKEYQYDKLRKYCTEKFSANVIIKKIINVYKEVIK